MFANPVGVSNTGYPVLAATDPPQPYGVVNPGASAGDVQKNATSIASGALFGERVSANADSSLFQPNISPDVVTVAVSVPKYFFAGGRDKVDIPQGTIVYLKKNDALQSNKHLSRATRDTGCIHSAYFGKFPQVNSKITEANRASFFDVATKKWPTVLVGPTTAHKNKVCYMAVAVQNCAHVSVACIDEAHKKPGASDKIGSRFYFCRPDANSPKHPIHPYVCSKYSGADTRELTLVNPITPTMLGTAMFDMGAFIEA